MSETQPSSYVRKFIPVPHWFIPNALPNGPYVESLTSDQVKLYWNGGTSPFTVYTGIDSGSLSPLLEQETSSISLGGYSSGQVRYFAVGSFYGVRNYGDVLRVEFP